MPYTKAQISLQSAQSDHNIRCPHASLAVENAPGEDSDLTAYARTDLYLRCAHISDGTFSDVNQMLCDYRA